MRLPFTDNDMSNSKKADPTAPQQHSSTRAATTSKANQASPTSPDKEDADEPIPTAKMHELLQKVASDQKKILDDQTKHFADVHKDVSETRRAVVAMEAKLADMLTRLTSAEARF